MLIVDDNADNAELLELGLKNLGHETWIAYDGGAAIELATQSALDDDRLRRATQCLFGRELS